MLIGDRLKALREQRNMSQGTIEERTVFFVSTFPAWRTATPFPDLKRLKNSLGRSKFRYTNFSTMERNRPRQVPFRHRQMRDGEVPGETPRLYSDFAN